MQTNFNVIGLPVLGNLVGEAPLGSSLRANRVEETGVEGSSFRTAKICEAQIALAARDCADAGLLSRNDPRSIAEL